MTILSTQIINELKKLASPQRASGAMSFFKTGVGQYGEGDIFIGVSTPQIKTLSLKFFELDFKELAKLINHPIHEARSLGLAILVLQYQKSKSLVGKKKIVSFYLKNKSGINNWDLVDMSAYKILGDYFFHTKNKSILKKLLKSNRHWDRRIAMVSTFAFIRNHQPAIAFEFAGKLLSDKEDLMHKASGWMLREAGKRDLKTLRAFIKNKGTKMPRTMLRYAIEKFSESERKQILLSTKA